MKKKNKIYIILLVVIALLIVSIPFVPPIYNRYTKPLYKNYVDGKEWYGKVDCENLSQVRDYCERRGIARTIISWWISPFHRARSGSSSTTCSMESVC